MGTASADGGVSVSLGNRLHIVDGMGSYIDFHKARFFRDARGHSLTSISQKRFRRYKMMYGARTRIGADETRYRALRTLNRVSKLLMISDQVRNRAAYLYKKMVTKSRVLSSANNILLVAACLLLAVREFGEDAPVTLDEISEVFARCGHRVSVRAIVRQLMTLRTLTGHAPSIRNPLDYVPRIVSMIVNNPQILDRVNSRGWNYQQYTHMLREYMIRIITAIPASKRGGRNPFIFSVSAAYAADQILSAQEGRKPVLTQKLTSIATGVAEYSIRDHYGIIKKALTSMPTIRTHYNSRHSAHQL